MMTTNWPSPLVCDLCQTTFGRVPSEWLEQLRAFDQASPHIVAQAFAEAKSYQAKHINYVAQIVQRLQSEASPGQSANPPAPSGWTLNGTPIGGGEKDPRGLTRVSLPEEGGIILPGGEEVRQRYYDRQFLEKLDDHALSFVAGAASSWPKERQMAQSILEGRGVRPQ